MKRKLVKQGVATLMVSLPSKWAKQNKLQKGDEIDIFEKENNLVLTLGDHKIKSETEINLQNLTESSIRTLITNAYRLGYDKIKLRFKHKASLKTIQDIVNKNIIGFEIISKGPHSCILENITEPSKDQFDNIFSKILMNIDELFELTKEALQGNYVEFEDLERNIQKFDNFCRRVISKEKLFENFQLNWAFHTKLIHAQREVYLALKYINKNKIKSSKEVLSLVNDCAAVFNMLKKAYDTKDIPLLEKVHEIEKQLSYTKGYNILNKTKNPVIVHYLLNCIRNLYLASSPLMGILIAKE